MKLPQKLEMVKYKNKQNKFQATKQTIYKIVINKLEKIFSK